MNNSMPEIINRPQCKQACKELLRSAQVSPLAFTALYLILYTLLDLISSLTGSEGILAIFVNILTWMLANVLSAGFILYCMDIRRNIRAEFLTLFDGFAFAGKLIGLVLIQTILITLWSLLFVIPGIIAAYRYSFALYDMCENPQLGIWEALSLSKKQTWGYKGQLFALDLSYLGWIILSALPEVLYTVYQEIQSLSMLSIYDTIMEYPTVPLYLTVLFSLWSLAVQLFYLPQYQCAQLSYYDTAKHTSGITPDLHRELYD